MDLTREQALAELKVEHHVGTYYIWLTKHGRRKCVVKYTIYAPHIRVDVFQLPGGNGLNIVEQTATWKSRSGTAEPPPRESGHNWHIHSEDGGCVIWRRGATCLTKAETHNLIRRYEQLRVQAGLPPRPQWGETPITELQE